jgi:hypothetical protein
MTNSEIDNLCNQKTVNETFFPIKEKLDSLGEDIEEIEFLFKNCWYNFNSLTKKLEELGEKIPLNPKIQETLQEFGEEAPKDVLKIGNIPIWEDIIVFEFHSFLTNIMRSVNFLIKFNLKNKEGQTFERWPSIKKFLDNVNNRAVHYYTNIKEEFDEWVSEVNTNRNNITHKWIEKRMLGTFSVESYLDESGKINLTKKITAGILEHDTDNLEEYCQDKLNRLKKFIESYFNSYSL